MRENTVLARMWVWAVRKRKIKNIWPSIEYHNIGCYVWGQGGPSFWLGGPGPPCPQPPVEPGLISRELLHLDILINQSIKMYFNLEIENMVIFKDLLN